MVCLYIYNIFKIVLQRFQCHIIKNKKIGLDISEDPYDDPLYCIN